MSALAAFQDRFGAALVADDAASAAAHFPLASHPAFAVYRNTVTRGLVDAIVANHPTAARLVGDEWLRAAATVFARAHPPQDPSLASYGAAFGDFLASFPPAAELPWLVPVARVDRAWTEAHGARDEPSLDPSALASMPPDRLADARLMPHAASRWFVSDDTPVHTLWLRSREGDGDLSDLEWRGEGVAGKASSSHGPPTRWTSSRSTARQPRSSTPARRAARWNAPPPQPSPSTAPAISPG
ncbi:MAG: DUF2063 domain-containing protein [Betaproteobacteria bacterium PRO3]|nr:DUF2063 domain-containing protein [Betaproteobacteria bacterium PRO3]